MFDSFDQNFENDQALGCVEEEEDDNEDEEHDFKSHRKVNILNTTRVNTLTHFNQLVDKTYNKILNQPMEIMSISQSSVKRSGQSSLKRKLFNLYLEENEKKDVISEPSLKNLNYSTNLLEKLVEQEQLNTLVLNFYPISQGYSLGFNIKSMGKNRAKDIGEPKTGESFNSNSHLANINKTETKLLSYDETELLYYINAGEIPPVLIDLIDRLDVNLYRDGCIIMEIRDYRRKAQLGHQYPTSKCNKPYELHFVLLQPSMQTLLADLNSITNDGNFIWTQEDKYTLESQLILATAQPLCLHPSPIVSILKHKFLNHKYKLNDRKLKRNTYKFTSAYLNRASRWNEYSLPLPFQIRKIRTKYSQASEYMHFQPEPNSPDKHPNHKPLDEKLKKQLNLPLNSTPPSSFLITSFNFHSVDNWSKAKPMLSLPREDSVLVKKFAKGNDRPKASNDQNLIPMEEIILDAVDKTSKNNYSKLLIKRRQSDDNYFCQLSLCIDQSNDVTFQLGLANEAEKYIQQYIKIFTEEGRRPVSITKNILNASHGKGHQVPSLLREYGYSNEPPHSSAFTSFAKNNTLTFQNYFNKKNSLDCNDKQLQTYQKFLYQQQQQQLNLHKQQTHSQQIQQHFHVQQQLQNQIKRVKTSSDEPQENKTHGADSQSTNLKSLIQSTASSTENQQSASLTKIYGNNSLLKNTSKTESMKSEPVVITSKSLSTKKISTSPSTTQIQPQNQATSKQDISQQKPQISTTVKITPNSPSANKSQATITTAGTQNSFVQIYVPKIATGSNLSKPSVPTSSSLSKSQTVLVGNITSTSNSSSLAPVKKTYTKKRTASSSTAPKVSISPSETLNDTKASDMAKKSTESLTTDINNNNTQSPTTSVLKTTKSIVPITTTTASSLPSTKIINASNLNLPRKIAIDSRLMPVIVTLNQNDANDPENQLKLKTQQQNQQIKLLNSRVTFKPTSNATSNMNDIGNVNTQPSDSLNTLNSSLSPIKTFQLQKSSPILKQVSFTYNPQNMHNVKMLHPSSNSNVSPSTSFLNTIPINSNNSSNDLQHALDKSASTKFIVTSSSASSPIQRNNQLQQQPGKHVATRLSSPTATSMSKPSLIIKKDE